MTYFFSKFKNKLEKLNSPYKIKLIVDRYNI